MKQYRIVTIGGDGIGPQVVECGLAVLEAAGRKHGFTMQFTPADWSSDRYLKQGSYLPEDWKETLRAHDAAFFGAVRVLPYGTFGMEPDRRRATQRLTA